MGSIFVSLFHFISFLFCSAQGYKRGGGKSSYFLSTAGLSPHRQRAPERRNLDTSGRERSRKSTQALHFSLNHSAKSLFVLGQLRSNPGEVGWVGAPRVGTCPPQPNVIYYPATTCSQVTLLNS